MRRLFALAVLCIPILVTGRLPDFSRADHAGVFDGFGLLAADVAELAHTEITAHPQAAVEPGQNLLWCGTFQLAWNEICQRVGEDLRFAGSPPEVVELLNRREFTAADLDAASYVAVADFVRSGVHRRIQSELDQKFGRQAAPRHLPDPARMSRPQDIVAYTYLFKHLEFATPFERLDAPLVFGTSAVSSFGIGEHYKPQHEALLAQVLICDFRHEDDFVIELSTRVPDDRLILAKVPPAATLAQTVEKVRRRADSAPTAALSGDVLQVPRLNFDLSRHFRKLEGRRLLTSNPQVADDLRVLTAAQNVRFQLDERGVRLRSESQISFGCGGSHAPPTEHRMVFDRPFLIMLSRREAQVPYFALWVGNADLLVPAN